MLGIILGAIKIIFLLGFLIFIHEGGHFLVAKKCNIIIKEFSIGFGPKVFSKTKEGITYSFRLIPLGGFVDMYEDEEVQPENDSQNKVLFVNASRMKRFAVTIAGIAVNMVFGIVLYFIIQFILINISNIGNISIIEKLQFAFERMLLFIKSIGESLVLIFSGKAGVNEMAGPVGISQMIVKTSDALEFFYLLSVISVSLGITNLLPIPGLDGGRLLLILIEAIRRKPIKRETEIKIQLLGLSFLMLLSVYITVNDISRII